MFFPTGNQINGFYPPPLPPRNQKNQFQRGDRITVILPNGKPLSGTFLQYSHLQNWVVCLDNPFPDHNRGDLENYLSKLYQVDAAHVLSNLGNKHFLLQNGQPLNPLTLSSDCTLVCNQCLNLQKRKNMFLCMNLHATCMSHFIPFNYAKNEIERYADSEIFDYVKEQCPNKQNMNTRALLLYHYWESADNFKDKQNAVSNLLNAQSFSICGVCDAEKSLVDIEIELLRPGSEQNLYTGGQMLPSPAKSVKIRRAQVSFIWPKLKDTGFFIKKIAFDFKNINTLDEANDDDNFLDLNDHLATKVVDVVDTDDFLESLRSTFDLSGSYELQLYLQGLASHLPNIYQKADSRLSNAEVLNQLSVESEEIMLLLNTIKIFWIYVESKNVISNWVAFVDITVLSSIDDLKVEIEHIMSVSSLVTKYGHINDLYNYPETSHVVYFVSGYELDVRYKKLSNPIKVIFQNCDTMISVRRHLADMFRIENSESITLISESGNQIIDSIKDLQKYQQSNIVFEIHFCENERCPTEKFTSFYTVSSCNHQYCEFCFEKYVEGVVKQREIDEENENAADIDDVLALGPEIRDPQAYLSQLFDCSQEQPSFRTINCLSKDCKCKILESDIRHSRLYIKAFNYAKDVIKTTSYQYCQLRNVLYCSEGKVPMRKLMSLGCDHYYHPSCLAQYVKGKVSDMKSENRQIVCYFCDLQGAKGEPCKCPDCHDSADPDAQKGIHTFNHYDANSLTARCGSIFTKDIYDNWNEYTTAIATAIILKLFECRCGARISIENDVVFYCICRRKYCGKCQRDAHDNMTCEEKRIRDALEFIPAGVTVQHCPFCDLPWSVPVNCLHATCEKNGGGCGAEFCYLCAAPRSPYMAHADNVYHRPSCEFYSKGCHSLCQARCFQNGKAVCEKSVVYDPLKCLECQKLGSLCAPPVDPPVPHRMFKILKKDLVEAEAEALKNKK